MLGEVTGADAVTVNSLATTSDERLRSTSTGQRFKSNADHEGRRRPRRANNISEYVAARSGEPLVFDLEQNPFGSEVKDSVLRAAFATQAAALTKAEDLRSALERMATSGGWSGEQHAIVVAATSEQFYDVFRGELSVPVYKLIQALLETFSHGTAQDREVAERAVAAVRKLGSESRLNAARARVFGVRPPQDDPPVQGADARNEGQPSGAQPDGA
jgi:hypothetical protein